MYTSLFSSLYTAERTAGMSENCFHFGGMHEKCEMVLSTHSHKLQWGAMKGEKMKSRSGRSAVLGESGNGATVPLSYQLYVAIKQDILTCELAPGAAITERWICKKHNASRTPIREACLWLARDGLLESIPNKGYAV